MLIDGREVLDEMIKYRLNAEQSRNFWKAVEYLQRWICVDLRCKQCGTLLGKQGDHLLGCPICKDQLLFAEPIGERG